MTLVLAIENSNPSSSGEAWPAVAIGRLAGVPGGGPGASAPASPEVLAVAELRPDSRHDDGLMPAVARACQAAGVEPGSLGLIAVSSGPGGFTAVRIGVTTAKVIAQAVGVRVACVPTAWAVRAAVGSHASTVVLAWKRDTVWCERFEGKEVAASESGLRTIGELGPALHESRTRDEGHALIADPRFFIALSDHGELPDGQRVLTPVFDACGVLACVQAARAVGPAEALPIYPREPEAVLKWRELHGKA